MIVRSKLLAPRLSGTHVSRADILQRIGDAPEARLVLLTAPAGFGKTSALAELVGPNGAVVSLDAEDADPNRFWAYVGYALGRSLGIDAEPLADALLGPGAPPVAMAVAAWTNMALDADRGGRLVLDDLHEVDEPAVLESLARFIERLPPTLQVVVATRTVPDLPLARWRAAGDLVEIEASDLRMSRAEAGEFLRHALGDRLTEAQVDALAERTEGWAAGLALAAASLARTDADAGGVIASFDGRRADVADYLTEQIMEGLAPDLRAFLEAVAVLDTLTPQACAAVAECDDAAARLEALERANLPIARLDERRSAYRLHRLLRDHLGGSVAAHRRAWRYFDAGGELELAFAHAVAAGDVDDATVILQKGSRHAISRSRPLSLLHDIRRLGRGLAGLDTPLLLSVAWAAFLCGRATELRAALAELHGRRSANELDDAAWSEICNMRSGMARQRGELEAAIELAEEGLACATEGRGGLLLYRAVAEFVAGQVDRAADSASACVAAEPGPTFVGITARSLLAQVRTTQGRLGEAERLCEAAAVACEAAGLGGAPMMAVLHRTLGRVAFERGQWSRAKELYDAALAVAEQAGLADLTAVIRGLTGHWALLTGDVATLDRVLAELEPVGHDAWLRRWRDSLVARRELGAGRDVRPMTLDPPADEEAWLVEIKRRRSVELSDELLARAGGRATTRVALLAAKAELLADVGRTAEADAVIADALRLSATTGIVRGFAEAEVDQCLARALGDETLRPAATVVRKALSELRHTEATPAISLSPRELEVLSVLAQGLSNQQAAARLHVSLATVKTHVHHIFHKLGVRRRTQAVAKARELELV